MDGDYAVRTSSRGEGWSGIPTRSQAGCERSKGSRAHSVPSWQSIRDLPGPERRMEERSKQRQEPEGSRERKRLEERSSKRQQGWQTRQRREGRRQTEAEVGKQEAEVRREKVQGAIMGEEESPEDKGATEDGAPSRGAENVAASKLCKDMAVEVPQTDAANFSKVEGKKSRPSCEYAPRLVDCRVCGVIPLEQVCHIHDKPLLGGLFGVGKNEFVGNVETQRLIMNFVPLNNNCRALDSDISTLPGISGLSPFMLEEGEIALLSSEDIRCFFFYLFTVPNGWFPYLGFNKLVPADLAPSQWKGKPCVLHARVLPWVFGIPWEWRNTRAGMSSEMPWRRPPLLSQGSRKCGKTVPLLKLAPASASTWTISMLFPRLIRVSRNSWKANQEC